ncbi:MAG: hypothetical protein CL908_24260 [Deltaproteobacteria bacterium]|nr:hypothetical protein [Deltaproteobacteria bacterium]
MPTHLQTVLRTLPGLLKDPFDLDLGIEFLHGIVDTPAMRLAFRQMLIGSDASERASLEALTRTPFDYDALSKLPETTFGGAYSRFMTTHGFDDPVRHVEANPDYVEDLERNWMFARFARVHDLYHVLLGIDVSPQEETAIHVFSFINARDPVGAVIALGLPYLALRYRKRGWSWAGIRNSIRAAWALPNMFRFPYESVLAEPLVEVRARVGLSASGRAAAW